jgi:hypothetical protein
LFVSKKKVFIEFQLKISEINIDYFLESLYPEKPLTTTLDEMKRRCKRGTYQKIIDVSNNILPTKKLFKIGDGGDGKNCFVCCTQLSSDRCDFSKGILESLENVGFNGHFLLLNGGYPNPTGTEMKYVAVPYSFKIFMIMEATKLGFERVVWIDAACYAVLNPEPLFETLEINDVLFRSFPPNCFQPNSCDNTVLPKTIELLNLLFNRDIRNDIIVNSIVFGLNLNSQLILNFINEYYEMVKLGLPFLSCFPEEVVFGCIFNKPEYKHILTKTNEMRNLYINEIYLGKHHAGPGGFFFMQRHYG